VKVVSPDAPIAVALHRMASLGIGCLVVTDGDGRAGGVLSERDVVRAMAHHGEGFLRLHVREVVPRGLTTCAPGDDVYAVMARMTQHRQRHLPVVDADGTLVGLVSIGDLVKSRLGDLELQTSVLRDAYVARL
jgi:CBS domain-containing protein